MAAAPAIKVKRSNPVSGELPGPGDRVAGRYRVIKRLGQGGMGTVFEVEDDATGRKLALKHLGGRLHLSGRGAHRQSRLRFRREFHTMARLRHPRIVEVYDYGLDERGPYYTMELLDGRDLRDVGDLTPAEACRLLRDVASALAFLHSRRLLHRDLAPRNVRYTSDGRAKLIDFGILATVGVCGEVAGTPPFICPENLRGLPLDHRADLYGLGALAYWLLTRRHAFAARSVEDLEELWADRPPPPSSFDPEVSPALDTLVLSLLSLDPLGRSASAAEVMDRLGAIGDLAPLPRVEATHGYLRSAELVGRQEEMASLTERIAKARSGRGRAVLIEAPSGIGKSRLLRELGLEAQVALMTVLRVDSESAGKGPYGLIRELGRELLTAAPQVALDSGRRRAPVIARVLPDLSTRIGPVTLAESAGDPAEERMRMQSELAGWFLDVAAERPIVIIVDDVQRCDEASAAVLATLAHEAHGAHLLLAVALRTDETMRAPAALAAMRDAGHRIRLRGLSRRDVGALVTTLFGAVPNSKRLAKWMHGAAGGSPLHCTELARSLVDQELVRYVDGEWVLPEALDASALPDGLAEAMDARIAALGAGSRAMAEALSIYGGELSLEQCALVAEERDESELFSALDELLFEEILIGSGDSYRFRHDGLREALLRSLDETRRNRLHLWVGDSLEAAGVVSQEQEAEIGWHLLRGGQVGRGAHYLERAGRRLYEAQSFSDAIPPLEEALTALEASDGSPRVRMELRHMLLMSGCMADRAVALRHVDATVELFGQASGVALAARLGPIMGRHLALALGVLWALFRWLFTWPGRRRLNPIEALRTFFVVVGYAATVYSLSYDVPAVRALVRKVDPIAIFKKRVPYAVYLLTCNLLAFPLGRVATVRRNSRQLLHILDTDRVTPISEIDRKTGGGGARFMLVLVDVSELSPSYVEELERLAELKLRFYEIGAQQAHVSFHRMRGEEEKARNLAADVEVLFVQLGSVWQMEAWLPAISSLGYGMTRDVLGLKRTIEAFQRQIDKGLRFEGFLDLARGEYHRERGELDQSEAALRRVLAGTAELGNVLLPQPATAALAETRLAAGDVPGAREWAHKAIGFASDEDGGSILYLLRSERVLALAEAASGDVEDAERRLDKAITRATPIGSPALCGSLHEARARVALLAGDPAAFRLHLLETERWFRPTRNPSLIARIDQLQMAERVAADTDVADVARDAVTAASARSDPRKWVSSVLGSCRGRSERAERALEILVQATSGIVGYLYLYVADRASLELVAPAYGVEPPAEVASALERAITQREQADGDAEESTVVDVDWGFGSGASRTEWQPYILATAGKRSTVIGAAAVVAGPMSLSKPNAAILEEIARGLVEAGDVTAGRVSTSATSTSSPTSTSTSSPTSTSTSSPTSDPGGEADS